MVQDYVVHHWPVLCTTDLRCAPWCTRETYVCEKWGLPPTPSLPTLNNTIRQYEQYDVVNNCFNVSMSPKCRLRSEYIYLQLVFDKQWSSEAKGKHLERHRGPDTSWRHTPTLTHVTSAHLKVSSLLTPVSNQSLSFLFEVEGVQEEMQQISFFKDTS